MRITVLSFSDMTSEPWIEGLRHLYGHEVDVLFYDKIRPHYEGTIIKAVNEFRPDIIVYFGYPPCSYNIPPELFRTLRSIKPIVFIAGDLADPPWWPLLEEYYAKDCFSLYVNIDGNDEWPCPKKNLTLLSPTAPHFYLDIKPLAERPIKVGFAGAYSSPSRSKILAPLIEKCGLVLHPRNEKYGSYADYAKFLTQCQIVISTPFTGSDAARQVKGRVLETGLAGACLLDHHESIADRWFKPGIDYFTYGNVEGAVNLIKYLNENLSDTQKMANCLRSTVLNKHNPGYFWTTVLEAAIS